jgi:hypothetical protein
MDDAPLILSLRFDKTSFARFDEERRLHFPPARNVAEGLEERVESIEREGKAFLGDLCLFGPKRQDDLVADDHRVVLAVHGKAHPVALASGRSASGTFTFR